MSSSPTTESWPGIADIRDAAARLQGVACLTPLLECPALGDRVGARLLLKCEMFQPMGAFKIRGAWNRVSHLSADQRKRGLVSFSSGNHAQATALAARECGVDATIVMPSDAPATKVARTRSYGAQVVTYDRRSDDRERLAADILDRTGAVLVHPYDDPLVIAGQGTVGTEIVEQCRKRDIHLDAAVVPCSGGGLVAGCAIALHDAWPEAEIHAAEPEGFDDTLRSLASGRRETAAQGAASICDALLVQTPGELTLAINRRHLVGGAAVSDDEVMAAMAAAFSELRVVVEPGGAAGLAAVLAGKLDVAGKTVCVVLSGGNVDPALFAQAIAGA